MTLNNWQESNSKKHFVQEKGSGDYLRVLQVSLLLLFIVSIALLHLSNDDGFSVLVTLLLLVLIINVTLLLIIYPYNKTTDIDILERLFE